MLELIICKKICGQCPFSKNALPGWLGDHDPDEILEDLQRDIPFSCHMARGEDPAENLLNLHRGKLPICRGFIASASASCKMFGQHPFYGKEMRKLQETITDEEKEMVLKKWDFKNYHTLKTR